MIFARDRFKIHWVSIDTGAVYSFEEMALLLKRYEDSENGKKIISGPRRLRLDDHPPAAQ